MSFFRFVIFFSQKILVILTPGVSSSGIRLVSSPQILAICNDTGVDCLPTLHHLTHKGVSVTHKGRVVGLGRDPRRTTTHKSMSMASRLNEEEFG